MLILVRRPYSRLDRVRISHPDGDVWVKILSVEGYRVKLGIDAPASVHILRGELVEESREA